MITTIILFAVLSSLTGSSYVLLILVPLFAAVLLELGYDKISSLTATIGSILVGSMACTYGFNVNGYINYYMGINDLNNQMVTKIILLVSNFLSIFISISPHFIQFYEYYYFFHINPSILLYSLPMSFVLLNCKHFF